MILETPDRHSCGGLFNANKGLYMLEKVMLSNGDTQYNDTTTAKSTSLTKKQVVILNLVIFAVLYLLLEVMVSTSRNIGLPVVMNYLISYWIIKSQIHKRTKNELIGFTWLISSIVLGIRILLGALLTA